ncbi:MAG: TetR family transcriptional regulator [Phycisphaera sp.]|nr:TetR family transcriptional regulator [Phycisphaera sp.]
MTALSNTSINAEATEASSAPAVIGPRPTRGTPGPVGFLSRQHILEATEACFDEVGYDGTTIRAISGRLGCSVGSIYRYFEDKRDLLLACASRVLQPVLDGAEAGASIEASVQTYVSCATERDEMYRLLFWLACVSERSDGVPAPVAKIIASWTGLLSKRGIAEHLWTLLHGLIMLGLDQQTILDRVLGDGSGEATSETAKTGDVAPTSPTPPTPGAPTVTPNQRLVNDEIDLSAVEIVQAPRTRWVEVVEADDAPEAHEAPTTAESDAPTLEAAAPSPAPVAETPVENEAAGDEPTGGREDMTLL